MYIMHFSILLILLPVFVQGQYCEPTVTVVNGRSVKCKNDVVFEDEFNNLDLSIWNKTIRISGDDYDFAYFTSDSENLYVSSGTLTIKPTVIEDDNYIRNGVLNLSNGCTEADETFCAKTAVSFSILPPVKSAQICTKNSFSFKYGKITVKAKLPSGDWVMPQIWLKPKSNFYGKEYMSGKVRIASARGNDDLVTAGGNHIGSKLLEAGILVSYDTDSSPIRARTVQFISTEPWSSSMHEFTLEWTPDNMKFYVDDRLTSKGSLLTNKYESLLESIGISPIKNQEWMKGTKLAPFDQEFYICIGVTAGGIHGFPDGSRSYGKIKPWKNTEAKNLLQFFKAKNEWEQTWTENTKLEVDNVKITAI